MKSLCDKLQIIGIDISDSERRAQRKQNSVQLLAVSKRHPASAIRDAYICGQRIFGENYVQEMLTKAEELADLDIEWHFIGPLQSNKTRAVAEIVSWVHTVDRFKIAKRLSDQRPSHLAPLSICIQVNISEEESKSGVFLKELPKLVSEIVTLKNIKLRGLMVIPKAESKTGRQREVFAIVRKLQEKLNAEYVSHTLLLDTLSMGMSADMHAAIAEGATIVRIGTAIFGARAVS